MNKNLNFKPGYYKITKIVESNVIEVEGTWFIKLKGVGDSTPKEEIKQWLKEDNTVRVVPYRRSSDARIISDVWLGNTHINKQFINYKLDNFIQAFEHWNRSISVERFSSEEDKLIQAFYIAESEINRPLKDSFKKWIESRYPQKRVNGTTLSVGAISEKREQLKNQMIKDFNEFRKAVS